jgi:hypothetical protein
VTNEARVDTGEWFDGMAGWGRVQRLLVVLLGLASVALVAAAPVTWLLLRPVRTSSSVPPPQWTEAAFRSGKAMRQLEQHVKESSWVTFELRGVFNETLLRFGMLHNDRVVLGSNGWMYLAETMRWKAEAMKRTQARRREIMQQALDLTRTVGIRLLVVPIPDKSAIYPEFVPPGELDPGRAGLYDQILADLSAVGVPHIDCRSLLLARKAANPDVRLFHQRDTHFQLDGQLAVADAVRQRLVDDGWMDLVVHEPTMVVGERVTRRVVPDLVRMLGLRSETGESGEDASAVVQGLMEDSPYRPVYLQDADGHHSLEYVQPRATVALCGTSFSQAMGPQLAGELRSQIDQRCVLGGGGSFGGIRKLAGEIGRDGFLPRILIWEFVERDYQRDWVTAKSLLD